MLTGAGPHERLRRFPLGASLGQCCGGVVNLLFEPVAGNAHWIAHARALQQARSPFVSAVTTTGDASAGRVVVTADSVFGGAEETRDAILTQARELLRSGGHAQLASVGGAAAARWFLDPVRDDCFDVVIFGAGHVGRALVKLLVDLPCRITWIDARDDEFPRDLPPNVDVVCSDMPEADVDAAPSGTSFLVMTHDHALDERISERILRRHDFAYFGLIGSLSKRRQFEQRMARRGMPAERFAAMTCPIGAAGIKGKAPAVIAVAVAAQLLQVWSAHAAGVSPVSATSGAEEKRA
jgi:xanthine dehydrogenase accessory factor